MPALLIVVLIIGIGAVGYFMNQSKTNDTADQANNTQTEASITQEAEVQKPSSLSEQVELIEETEALVDGSTYIDGSYTADASYSTPNNTEHEMSVELTVDNDIVTDASVLYDNGAAQTPNHLRFDSAFKAEVIGKQLQNISLSRTGGASLTSDAFNEALADIKIDAQS